MEKNRFGVPENSGWRASGDWKPTDVRSPYIMLTWRQLKDVVPFLFRFFWYWIRRVRDREGFSIDPFRPLSCFPYYGVPCGGMGCGSIGRDFRGAFCKFSLRPGFVEQHVQIVPENQFIVTIRRDEKTVYQKVLSVAPVPKNKLKAWDFEFPAKNLQYVGLYPRSWTTYEIPEHKITLCCRQMSPMFPNDYKDTSLPVTLFSWTVENQNDFSFDVSITFTFRNGTGDPRWQKEAPCTSSTLFPDSNPPTIDLQQKISGMPCTYLLSAESANDIRVSSSIFDVTGDGSDIWKELYNSGKLSAGSQDLSSSSEASSLNSTKNQLAIALCCQVTVVGHKSRSFNTCLTWYMPKVWFSGQKRTYNRRYTTWFKSGIELSKYSLENCDKWTREIDAWQNATFQDQKLPNWYKTAIFNELYYLTDGGSVWFNYDPSWRIDEPHLQDFTCKQMENFGRFAYLESYEYRMFSTYDVHFYSSFALAVLFPRLQLAIQAEFSDQFLNEDARPFKFFYDGDTGMIKHRFRLPHDLGCPGAEPWLETNAYVMHNTANWKDLNLKFILTCMRDYFLLANNENERLEFLRHVWTNIQTVINVGLDEWDSDKDGMIENGGTCDQTYDSWQMHGTSAYCGSLWLGAVKSAQKIAEILDDKAKREEYGKLLDRAKEAFNRKLWKHDYYKFDEFSSDNEAVMADQLCGYWFLTMCNLEQDVLPEANVEKSLRKLYELNVGRFGAGHLGAVNGRLLDGKADGTSLQSNEMWTGVSYAVASLMLCKGMVNEGFSVAEGVYGSVFGRLGLQFQSPEAVYETKNCRAIGYMRAMAIWAMHWALNNRPTLTRL